MKKVISIVLAVLMITAMFSGCKEPEPLRVLVDIEYQGLAGRTRLDMVMENFAFSLTVMYCQDIIELLIS